MKRSIFLVITYIFTAVGMYAQIQNGHVKTIGRPGKPGKDLPGVIIRPAGSNNDVVSDDKGAFSFAVKGNTFKFQNIRKSGYELADKDVVGCTFGYNKSVPVELSLISRSEFATVKSEIEDKLYNQLQAKYALMRQAFQKELERHKINELELQHKIDSLSKAYSGEEKLIDALSEQLARIDYDRLDSLNSSIQSLIEQGQFEKAAEKIASKGDMDERIKQLDKEQKFAKQVNDTYYRNLNDAAKDLWNLYTISKQKEEYGPATGYLEKRANLDTTNIEWQMDRIRKGITFRRPDFPNYVLRAIRLVKKEHAEMIYLSECYENLVRYYSNIWVTVVDNKSIAISYSAAYVTFPKDSAIYYKDLALKELKEYGIDNYNFLRSYARDCAYTAEDEAILIYSDLASRKDHAVFRPSIYRELGYIYKRKGDYKTALKYFLKNNSTATNTEYIAECYRALHKYKQSLEYYQKCYKSRVESLDEKYSYSHRWISEIADSLSDIYLCLKDYKNAATWMEKSINHMKEYIRLNPSTREDFVLAYRKVQLASLLSEVGEFDKAESLYHEALVKAEEMVAYYIDVYQVFIAKFTLSYAYTQALKGNFELAYSSLETLKNHRTNKVFIEASSAWMLNVTLSPKEYDEMKVKIQELQTKQKK